MVRASALAGQGLDRSPGIPGLGGARITPPGRLAAWNTSLREARHFSQRGCHGAAALSRSPARAAKRFGSVWLRT